MPQDFESGIERLVLLTAKENASKKGKTELVESFMNLPEIIGPGVVQLTAGFLPFFLSLPLHDNLIIMLAFWEIQEKFFQRKTPVPLTVL